MFHQCQLGKPWTPNSSNFSIILPGINWQKIMNTNFTTSSSDYWMVIAQIAPNWPRVPFITPQPCSWGVLNERQVRQDTFGSFLKIRGPQILQQVRCCTLDFRSCRFVAAVAKQRYRLMLASGHSAKTGWKSILNGRRHQETLFGCSKHHPQLLVYISFLISQ